MTTPLEQQLAAREQQRKCQAEDDYWKLVDAAASTETPGRLDAPRLDELSDVLRTTGRSPHEFDQHVAVRREHNALQSAARSGARERVTRELAQAQAAYAAEREKVEAQCTKLRARLEPLADQVAAAEAAARSAQRETERLRALEADLRRDRRPRGELLLGSAGFARAVSKKRDAAVLVGELEQQIRELASARDRLVHATSGLQGIARDRSEEVATLRRVEAELDVARCKLAEQQRRLRSVEQELGIEQVPS